MTTWRYANDLFTLLAARNTNQDLDCVAHTRARIQNVVRDIMDFMNDLAVFATVITVGLALIYYYSNRK